MIPLSINTYPDLIKLESGKCYGGRIDGEFEIKTINDELYLIPKTNCIDFYEKDKDENIIQNLS